MGAPSYRPVPHAADNLRQPQPVNGRLVRTSDRIKPAVSLGDEPVSPVVWDARNLVGRTDPPRTNFPPQTHVAGNEDQVQNNLRTVKENTEWVGDSDNAEGHKGHTSTS